MSLTDSIWDSLPQEPHPNFCIAPFQSIRQNAYGRNSPCAFGAGEWHHGNLTPKQRWDSEELNQLRQEFVEGKRPAACHRCWAEEDAGKESLRQRQFQYFPNDYRDYILTGQWKQGPKTAVFKTSNVCNLACRSCGGWDSNFYTKEGEYYREQYDTRIDGKPHNRFIPLLPPKHIDFMQYTEIAQNFEKIDFFGGEPFLNTTQLDFLEWLVDQGLSKNITLFYSTNCTNKPTPRLQRAWDKFKRIEISVSIDGLGNEFEYMRWPGKWSECQEVVDHVLDLKNTLNAEVFTMAGLTVSLLNVTTVDQTHAWLQEKIGHVYVNMVNFPDYLALHSAPEYVKSYVRSHVKHQESLGYIDINKPNPLAWKQFIIWTKRQDLYRKQSFETTFPEFYKLIKPDWDAVTDLSETNFYS